MNKKSMYRSRLAERRNKLGMTQEDLAIKVGVAPNYIAMIERGERSPSVALSKRLEEQLNIPWNEIIENI